MKILVIGSGPSGVHFALSALRKGHHVTMVDVGNTRGPTPAPAASFLELKRDLDDPVQYFLGSTYDAVTLPAVDKGGAKEYYGLPASKDYVFARPPQFAMKGDGFAPLLSFAAGGLAESWTGGAYPLSDDELAEFPFSYADIAPHYGEVARRIGVGGVEDDLSEVFPPHGDLTPPTTLDTSGAALLASYESRRAHLHRKHRARLGRSRQAVLTAARGEREACRSCGRCLWGCPNGAFYTPSLTLAECRTHETFEYRPGRFVSHFALDQEGMIGEAIAYPLSGGAEERVRADAYILAAGALCSANIVMRSHYAKTREIIRLEGLMDNRQALAPFFNLSMLGKPYDPNTYQYHQLAFALLGDDPTRHVHGQITTLKAGTAHPILQNLPLDLKTAAHVFRSVRSGLCVANLNFCDWRRPGNYATLSDEGGEWPVLSIRYRPAEGEARTLRSAIAAAGRFFADIGAPFLPGMAHVRPMGGSVHYAGLLPMSSARSAWTVSPHCQSHDIANLYVVDGAAIPFLPAKNLTFTLMANAIRVAETAF